MTETQRCLVTAGLVVMGAASVVLGLAARDHVDLGGQNSSVSRLAGKGALVSRTLDTDIPEAEYFEQLTELLKREYVEPIQDDVKLANGAVRGMILSLGDERCLFFDEKAFPVHQDALKGAFQGIGAEFAFVRTPAPQLARPASPGNAPAPTSPAMAAADPNLRIPRLVVAWVVPGGPAEKAGVRAGDWVESIDGKWVVSPDLIDRARETQLKVTAGEWPPSRLQELRKEIREKTEHAIMPVRARERLTSGKDGTVKVVWNRGSQQLTTSITRSVTQVPAFRVAGNSVQLRFIPGVEKDLAAHARANRAFTIDLRGQAGGSLAPMLASLEAIAPAGTFGELRREGGKPARPLKVSKGNPNPPKLTILVDRYTRGVPEIFAKALKGKGIATVQGTPANDPSVVETRELPGGSGYTLVTGVFRAPSAGPAKGASK